MQCNQCSETKAKDDFYTSNLSTCKECKKENVREYKRNNKGYHRRSMLMKTYGLSLERFNEMLEEQGHCCAICKADNPGDEHSFRVDHNHDTGEVRGLLCNACNLTLGNAKEDATRLRACADYLDERGSYVDIE
jgi:hypothetical protein